MKKTFLIAAIISIAGLGSYTLFVKKSNNKNNVVSPAIRSSDQKTDNKIDSKKWIDREVKVITAQASNIDPTALKVSLVAYVKAREKGLDQKQVLTVIDFSKPSNERRLWVIDVKNSKVLMNTWVAHGKNSGGLYATNFSNTPHSLKSSLGVFVTTSTYSGKHGYSMRIEGLEHGFNDNAANRDVVFHGASYAGADVAKSRGMLGRSWGCMAVGQDTITPLVNAIKNNTVVVAYYPAQNWLQHSTWVNSLAA